MMANAIRLDRGWRLEDRRSNVTADAARREQNARATEEGRPLQYIYRSLYVPEEGKFCALPRDLGLGTIQPEAEVRNHEIVLLHLCKRSRAFISA